MIKLNRNSNNYLIPDVNSMLMWGVNPYKISNKIIKTIEVASSNTGYFL